MKHVNFFLNLIQNREGRYSFEFLTFDARINGMHFRPYETTIFHPEAMVAKMMGWQYLEANHDFIQDWFDAQARIAEEKKKN